MNKKNFKVFRIYIVSVLCIVCFFLLENTTIIPELVQISEKGRYSGFPTFFLTGLLKYGLLALGIFNIIIMTFIIFREKRRNRLNK
ncbi:hypothetical protein DPN68_01750 [Flavobacterium tibetense]|jgi:type II secretory pathway component PulF|uniref:Uncharacterized protein n=1 Tax=Flavobacterium tibetense TaxID=2233533 RepID=A0A365P4N4_9FLAO|nr:hypothetical protein DPN68_01750 [Flavobacterium tibetense]